MIEKHKRAHRILPYAAPMLLAALLVLWGAGVSLAGESASRLLDGLDSVDRWRLGVSDDIKASLCAENGALRLDFDFNGVAGFAGFRRELPLAFSGNYALSLRVRGESPVNDLQVKLIDAGGDNVWWINRPGFVFNGEWQTIRAERQEIEFAWGPSKDRTLRKIAAVEITLAAGRGGSGRIWFDDLRLEKLPRPRTGWPAPVVKASSCLPRHEAALAMDGNAATAWRSDPAEGAGQSLEIDFRALRPFGGLVLQWLPGEEASRYEVHLSGDGRNWRKVRRVSRGNGGRDPLLLSESRARYVRFLFQEGPASSYGLSEIEIKDRKWGASPNGFFQDLAKTGRRGLFPRGFSGEQSYWTVVGVDGGGADSALISEDGAIELHRGGFSIEPFLIDKGRLITWADASISRTLEEGYLPMPRVTWETPELKFSVEAFAAGSGGDSRLLTRYNVENRTGRARTVTLALAVRPFQVNPPDQFLNCPGGVSPVHELEWSSGAIQVNGRPRVFPLQRPDGFFAVGFDSGGAVSVLESGRYPPSRRAIDDSGHASGAMLYRLTLPAYGREAVHWLGPLSGMPQVLDAARQDPDAWTAQERNAVAAEWRAKLNRVLLSLPRAAREFGDTLRSSLAWILISRDGPALQPGTRSYARTWIRDGAMISQALLRMGHPGVVRDFILWYAPHQFSNGKVPCCVDARGADPVAENDSHGEMVFTAAELHRFTRDRAALEALWPHVIRAIDYMERLRAQERTPENLSPERRANYGLMPASISHEGYAAKPVHSYWDDFWALQGYEDGRYLALALGKSGEALRMAEAGEQFRNDLHASIRTAVKQHRIDYLPGSAELGDFDATSTTIALSPGGEQSRLPQDILENTFDRYWREFASRREKKTGWDDYTPYELRTLAAFIRLGQRDRVQPLLDFFLADRRPNHWNGWAEVVRSGPRRPGFIGDMPHAWIASDYIRSALDMFAYRRADDGAMVLAAGLPGTWFEDEAVGISGLHTPWGRLGYTLRREGDRLLLSVDAEAAPPGGFIFPWPFEGQPGKAWISGGRANWKDRELRIPVPNAEIIMEIPPPRLEDQGLKAGTG